MTSQSRKSLCAQVGHRRDRRWLYVADLIKTCHRNNLIRRFGTEETAQMRTEMLTRFASDTEMPPMRRPSCPGRIVDGEVLEDQ